jgi:hypothetical protein
MRLLRGYYEVIMRLLWGHYDYGGEKRRESVRKKERKRIERHVYTSEEAEEVNSCLTAFPMLWL